MANMPSVRSKTLSIVYSHYWQTFVKSLFKRKFAEESIDMINLPRLTDTYMRHETRQSLVQILAYAKPLSEPMLITWKQILWEIGI